MKRALILNAVAVLLLAACTSDAKREAASLASAVERYRHAENVQKPNEEATIAAVQCTDAEVCDAKRTCIAMSEPTSRGLVLKAEVEQGLKDLEQKRISPDSDAARALPGKLEESSRLLEQGRASLAPCDQKLVSLRLKYGL